MAESELNTKEDVSLVTNDSMPIGYGLSVIISNDVVLGQGSEESKSVIVVIKERRHFVFKRKRMTTGDSFNFQYPCGPKNSLGLLFDVTVKINNIQFLYDCTLFPVVDATVEFKLNKEYEHKKQKQIEQNKDLSHQQEELKKRRKKNNKPNMKPTKKRKMKE